MAVCSLVGISPLCAQIIVGSAEQIALIVMQSFQSLSSVGAGCWLVDLRTAQSRTR